MEENSRARPLFVFHRSGASTFSNNNKNNKYKYNCSRQNKSFGLTSSSIGIVIYNDIDDINNNDDNNKSNKQIITFHLAWATWHLTVPPQNSGLSTRA